MEDIIDYGYEITDQLGKGGYGTVYKARHILTNQIYVIKVIETGKMLPYQKEMVENEIMAMMDLSTDENCSPYIVCYHDSFDISGAKCIVMEYIDGPDLFDFIAKGYKFSPDELLRWMNYLAQGLSQIHHKGYAHRDIKPENILTDQTKNVVKIIDLGFICSTRCRYGPASLYYAPPELFFPEIPGLHAAQAHDIWSLGVTFYIMANSKFPFINYRIVRVEGNNGKYVKQKVPLDQEAIIKKIKNKEIHKSDYRTPPGLLRDKKKEMLVNKIIDLMLTLNWELRPPIDHILTLLNKSKKCTLS